MPQSHLENCYDSDCHCVIINSTVGPTKSMVSTLCRVKHEKLHLENCKTPKPEVQRRRGWFCVVASGHRLDILTSQTIVDWMISRFCSGSCPRTRDPTAVIHLITIEMTVFGNRSVFITNESRSWTKAQRGDGCISNPPSIQFEMGLIFQLN